MRDYLLVYILFQGMKKEERYISYMVDSLSDFCGEVLYLMCEEEKQLEETVERWWKNKKDGSGKGMIVVTGKLFGPFWSIEDDLEAFETGDKQVMVYYRTKAVFPDFLLVKKGVEWDRFHMFLNQGPDDKFSIREDLFCPFSLLLKGVPFLNMDCFGISDQLKYTMGEETVRAFDWIRHDTSYDIDMIWEIILKRYNLYDIKHALQLNYIIPERPLEVYKNREKKAAVVLHLFYDDLLEEVIDYIKGIPSFIDIYISTCPNQIEDFSAKLEKADISVTGIVKAGKRGRDAGALLVAFRPYLMKYEYICFLHDKKTSGGMEAESVGRSFMRLMWESLLKDQNHIQGILKLFEENSRLGILAPPFPMVGMYVDNLLGAEWTVCFEETLKLAKRLNCPVRIDKEKPVFALSTSFWCRTAALEPLFSYPWTFEDFPEEPLRLDGTINHAIERIISYIAQEQGYYSGVATTLKYASGYMENLQYMLDDVFCELHRGDLLDLQFPLRLNRMIEELCRLAIFCKMHKKIFVYGAGARAESIIHRLNNLQIPVECAVVTENKDRDSILEYPIKIFSEIQRELDKDCGVILAMNEKFQEEVVERVEEAGVDYFRV